MLAREHHEDRQRTAVARLGTLERFLSAWDWAYGAAVLGLVGGLVLVAEQGYRPLVLIGPGAAILLGYVAFEHMRRQVIRLRRLVAYHQRALARFEGTWAGLGPTGDEHATDAHPYAFELDVLGRGSVFDYLCTARTRIGQSTLARLLEPAGADTIRMRQASVKELCPCAGLREDLAAEGEDNGFQRPDEIVGWAESPGALSARPVLWAARLLALWSVATGVGAMVLGWSPWFPAGGVVASFILAGFARDRLNVVFRGVVDAHRELSLIARVAERLERESFRSPLAASLQRELVAPSAARAIARLGALAARTSVFRNEIAAPFALALGLPLQLAASMELWRERHGARVRRWLDAVGQFDALLALAAHAFENPDHTFAEIVDGGRVLLEAEGLGHPLIPSDRCVRNDIRLGGDAPALLLLSGSNMSGKSTLLRATGLAAALGLAGAPVRARRLRLRPVAVGASVRARDSVLDGISRFLSEVTRLRGIVAIAEGERPLLFLLDEILSGTNSHDRRLGAQAILEGLLERGAIGICTTHDLALTKFTGPLEGRSVNAHFSDEFRDGKITFDYTLRPGVIRHSNALELMRAVGLRL